MSLQDLTQTIIDRFTGSPFTSIAEAVEDMDESGEIDSHERVFHMYRNGVDLTINKEQKENMIEVVFAHEHFSIPYTITDPIEVELLNKVLFPFKDAELAQPEPEKGLRYNDGKLPMHLVPISAIKAMAEVLDVGQRKYAPRNWEKGFDYSVPYSCAMRHLLAWWGGEDKDAESGLHHLKHVLTNVAFLVEFLETHPELDDRSKK